LTGEMIKALKLPDANGAMVASFREATKDVKAGGTVLLLVRRDDRSSFIGLTVPGDKDDE
jgi:hypothetical protein